MRLAQSPVMTMTVALAALHPTQMTLGLREVARRMANYLALMPEARVAYIAARPVPCVLGPDGDHYLIDRHHLCRALMDAGVEQVPVLLVHDLQALSGDAFWAAMSERGLVHPFDRNGARRQASEMPRRLADMSDDPYRSLASVVRRENGYAKADVPFEEFAWANLLRAHFPLRLLERDFTAACAEALLLARSPTARHLPGWLGLIG